MNDGDLSAIYPKKNREERSATVDKKGDYISSFCT